MSRWLAVSQVTSLPSIYTLPSVTASKPEIMRSVVVLPQPEGPSSATNSPLRMVRSIGFTAHASPNFLATCLSSISAISSLEYLIPRFLIPSALYLSVTRD